jgi:hypothetical protein
VTSLSESSQGEVREVGRLLGEVNCD